MFTSALSNLEVNLRDHIGFAFNPDFRRHGAGEAFSLIPGFSVNAALVQQGRTGWIGTFREQTSIVDRLENKSSSLCQKTKRHLR